MNNTSKKVLPDSNHSPVFGSTNLRQGVEYEKKSMKKIVIDIDIICRRHDAADYTGNDGKNPPEYHYYIYYKEGKRASQPEFLVMFEENKPPTGLDPYKGTPNLVSKGVYRGQQIIWRCKYPFTIYFGGKSVITTDKLGWARPRQIIPYLKAYKEKGSDFYQTIEAFIVNNALSGAYKYFVSVYIPSMDENGMKIPGGDIVCVDDPETVVPPPKR